MENLSEIMDQLKATLIEFSVQAQEFAGTAFATSSEAAKDIYATSAVTAARLMAHAGPMTSSLLRPVAEAVQSNSRAGLSTLAKWTAATIGNATEAVPAFLLALQESKESIFWPKSSFLKTHSHAILLCATALVGLTFWLTLVCPSRKAKTTASVRGQSRRHPDRSPLA